MARTSIAGYLELPRFGQCHSSEERVSGVGPCVQIFSKWSRKGHPVEEGMKLFDEDDNVKFLLNLQPNLDTISRHYFALSHRAISVFELSCFKCYDGKVTEKLCDDNDEIIGHGVVKGMKYKINNTWNTRVAMMASKFKILVVFKSGVIRRVVVRVSTSEPDLQMKINMTTEYKSAAGTLIAAPHMDKSNIVLIYEDTIVKGDGTVCRGTPAEGRQVIFAEGGFPWKGQIFLVTDDGEVHYAKMTGKVGDGKISLFGSGNTIRSSRVLKIRQPTCACLWDKRVIVVGNENGELYRLNKKNLRLINEYAMKHGPLTFLQSHGHELWIGWKEGDFKRYDDIC